MQLKPIYSKKVAIALRELGFAIVKTAVNHYKPELDVYYFEDTQEFNSAFDDLMKGWNR